MLLATALATSLAAGTRNNAALPVVLMGVLLLAVLALGAPSLARRINRRRGSRSLPHS